MNSSVPLLNESSSDEQSDSFSEESKFYIASKGEKIELEFNVKKEHRENERHPSLNTDSPSAKSIKSEKYLSENGELIEAEQAEDVDMDTISVAKRIKQCLVSNGISQRVRRNYVVWSLLS